jgi:hypothetical protein
MILTREHALNNWESVLCFLSLVYNGAASSKTIHVYRVMDKTIYERGTFGAMKIGKGNRITWREKHQT